MMVVAQKQDKYFANGAQIKQSRRIKAITQDQGEGTKTMQTQIADSTADFVEIEGKRLYYEMAGAGATIVLAHAGFLDHGMWDDQWHLLSQHYRVIRYDMRGYGKSDALAGPTTRRAELYALLTQLGIDAAYLVGCSLGGEMMLDFTLEYPGMVKGLVLVNSTPSGFEMQGEPPADVLALIEAIQQRDVERITELQLRLWIDGPFRQPNEVDVRVRQRAAQMNQIPVRNFTWVVADMQPANPLNPPAVQQLHNIQVPTLVVVGALDNPEIKRAAGVMVAGIPGAQKVVVEHAAHVPSMEQPASFNRVVLDFLKRTAA
jgi:pimeloyl-ACP methyl ester carboxylesterase